MKPFNSLIYYDRYNYDRNSNLREFSQNTYLTALLESVQRRCVLVLWGDGTMLRAIGEYASENIPFLGINFWHKGFLLNHPNWVYPDIPEFETRRYPLLQVSNNWKKIWNAFNDVHIYSPEGKAISLNVRNSFWELELWGDGLILATPAGSTGHSKSYGWPILPHTSKNLVITPKGNIEAQSPKAIEDSHNITIQNTWRKYPLGINLDGAQAYLSRHDEGIYLSVEKSHESIELLISAPHTRDWDKKVMQEQGFRV